MRPGDIRPRPGFAACLCRLGDGRGDRIGLHSGQHPDSAVAHRAIAKLGDVAATLSQRYGPETLAHAMQHCRTRVPLPGDPAWAALRGGRAAVVPDLVHVLTREPVGVEFDLGATIATDPAGFTPGTWRRG